MMIVFILLPKKKDDSTHTITIIYTLCVRDTQLQSSFELQLTISKLSLMKTQ